MREFLIISAILITSFAPVPRTQDLPAAPGGTVFQRMCSGCHDVSIATSTRMSKDRWTATVNAMVMRGAVGTEREIDQVIDYLSTNFGPAGGSTPKSESQKKPSVPKDTEWSTYGGNLANWRYSPLDQVSAKNFTKLQIAWRFKTFNLGPRPEYNLEATPLLIHGVLFTTAGSRRAAVALDAASGELLWMHSENEGLRGAVAARPLSGRGLAYWTDGTEERVLYVTPGYRLAALNAKTGTLVSSFGDNGVVDLKLNDDQEMDPINSDIGLHAAPIIAGNTIIIGAAHRSGDAPESKSNVKGYVRGFDVRTGKRLWIFHTIPKKGEYGYDTWEDGAAEYTGNTGVWAQMSVDPELGLAYLPVELPTGDYYGGHRRGNALFAESIVAVDLKTGQRKWHYQLVHHGMWDMDIPCAPILVDIKVDGKPIKALAQPTKQAILYVLNRATGEPVWPFMETPVPQGDTPGEWYSPTQPIPTKPPFYDRNGSRIEDLIDFTPQLRQEAMELVSKYKLGPVFTPPVVIKPEGPFGTLLEAGAGNIGTNWAGGSYDPETHMLYVFSEVVATVAGLAVPERGVSDMNYIMTPRLNSAATIASNAANAKAAGNAAATNNVEVAGEAEQLSPPPLGRGPGARRNPPSRLVVGGLPLFKPPYGKISAINLDRGEIVWAVAHGETPDNIRNHPALKGLAIPRTGRPGIIGVLTTKTLVIAGEGGTFTDPTGKKGALLRAYDKATGKDAGAVLMPAGQTGSPMTYMLNGKQYIVIAVGGPGYPAEFLAYKLPD